MKNGELTPVDYCHLHSGLRLKEIGKLFGMRESALCEASRRIRARMERDAELQKQVEAIREELKI